MNDMSKNFGADPTTVAREKKRIVIDSPELQRAQWRIAAATIFVPFLGTVAAIVSAFWIPPSAVDIAMLVLLYCVTLIGATVGLHRYFSHRSFKATKPLVIFLGIAGSMAAQGRVIYWVATHRRHHQFSEEELDPHSPYQIDGKPISKLRGIWHSHVGWMMDSQMTNTAKYAKDLQRDPLTAWINRTYPYWVVLGFVIPGVVGGLAVMSWTGVLTGVLWGGFVRMFLAHHMMWTSGSTAHIIGTRPFESRDKSTNNSILAALNMGEGWHNNHHAFPSSAMFGLRWWQIDGGAWFIRAAEKLGLASDIRRPTDEMIEARRRSGDDAPAGVQVW